ncbi:MAG: helix-turn-helix domain-containing protein [Acidobacteria bacterium]|nr:MAG: helix-turn-helix domain-containing protein [Acidobacteriota bacterium]
MVTTDKFRELREKLGWNRQQLATHLQLSEEEVAAFEDGRSQPTDEQLAALERLADSSLAGPLDPFLDLRLHRVKDLVESTYPERISLATAAAAACLERKYFSKFFRRAVGIPFSVWLSEFRIEKAKELLSTRDDPVLDIAFRVGFQSMRTFERRFRRVTGLTPHEFRRKRRRMAQIGRTVTRQK